MSIYKSLGLTCRRTLILFIPEKKIHLAKLEYCFRVILHKWYCHLTFDFGWTVEEQRLQLKWQHLSMTGSTKCSNMMHRPLLKVRWYYLPLPHAKWTLKFIPRGYVFNSSIQFPTPDTIIIMYGLFAANLYTGFSHFWFVKMVINPHFITLNCITVQPVDNMT